MRRRGAKELNVKRFTLFLSIAAMGASLIASEAHAQRIFVERPGASVGIRYAGDSRAANSLRHLNDELRQAQFEVRRFRGEGRRIRYSLGRIAGATDRLNFQYNKRRVRPWVIHRRAEQLRAEVRAIRRDLRVGRRWR